jgi:hypothetical protein
MTFSTEQLHQTEVLRAIEAMTDFPDERQSKRRKLERTHGPPIEINRVEDLQNALVFKKSSSPEIRKGQDDPTPLPTHG